MARMIESPLFLTAAVVAITALGFWLERNVQFLSRVGASLLVILFGALLSNLGLVPARSPVYGAITGPVTSLAIAWLLLSVHIGDLRLVGPRMAAAYGLAAAGTVLGAAVGTLLFAPQFAENTWRLAGAFTGTYTGGSLNFVAVGRGLELPETLFAGATAADNLTTGLWLGACLLLPVWLRRFYPTPIPGEENGAGAGGTGVNGAGAAGDEAESDARPTERMEESAHPFFRTAPVSVLSLAGLFALGFLLLAAARGLGTLVPQVPTVLWLTTLALAVAHVPRFSRMDGALQLGNFALHLFFAVIGIYSRIGEILSVGVSVFFFTLVVVGIHGLVVYGGGRLLNMDVGTLSVASQAAVGGPSSALAVAVSRRWRALILPGIVVGLLGYAAGNYLGYGIGYLMRALGF